MNEENDAGTSILLEDDEDINFEEIPPIQLKRGKRASR